MSSRPLLALAVAAVGLLAGCASPGPAAPGTSAPVTATGTGSTGSTVSAAPSAAATTPAGTSIGTSAPATTSVAPTPATSAPAAGVPAGVFAGTWTGHTRGMTITASGAGTEEVGEGCCDPLYTLRFTLTGVDKLLSGWRAEFVVTASTVQDQAVAAQVPPVGATGQLVLSGSGEVVSTLTALNYCGEDATPGACGA